MIFFPVPSSLRSTRRNASAATATSRSSGPGLPRSWKKTVPVSERSATSRTGREPTGLPFHPRILRAIAGRGSVLKSRSFKGSMRKSPRSSRQAFAKKIFGTAWHSKPSTAVPSISWIRRKTNGPTPSPQARRKAVALPSWGWSACSISVTAAGSTSRPLR